MSVRPKKMPLTFSVSIEFIARDIEVSLDC
jgi:hypothetical protein